MAEDFDRYKNPGTDGIELLMDNDLFYSWIGEFYKAKNVKYFIIEKDVGNNNMSSSNFVIFPIEHFQHYFNVSAKYRRKKSGSTNPTENDYAEITKAAKALAKAIKADGIFFAIDQKFENKEYFENIKSENIHILEMNLKRYPCGTPREIISNFNRSLAKKYTELTLTNKDLFLDASTMYEVYKAVICSIPSISKLVHFSGNCLRASCLLNVKIGSTLKDIVAQLGGFIKNPHLIIINGSICGSAVQSFDVPITKYVKSVEFISKINKKNSQIYSCINCGNCRFACPVHLSPDILYTNTINFKFMPENFAASSIACIECGLCNTVCPARLPLSQTISLLKDKFTKE